METCSLLSVWWPMLVPYGCQIQVPIDLFVVRWRPLASPRVYMPSPSSKPAMENLFSHFKSSSLGKAEILLRAHLIGSVSERLFSLFRVNRFGTLITSEKSQHSSTLVRVRLTGRRCIFPETGTLRRPS